MRARAAEAAARDEASRARWRACEARRQHGEQRQQRRRQAQRTQHAQRQAQALAGERAHAQEAKAAQERRRVSGFLRAGFAVSTGAAATPLTGFTLPMLAEPSWRTAVAGPATRATLRESRAARSPPPRTTARARSAAQRAQLGLTQLPQHAVAQEAHSSTT